MIVRYQTAVDMFCQRRPEPLIIPNYCKWRYVWVGSHVCWFCVGSCLLLYWPLGLCASCGTDPSGFSPKIDSYFSVCSSPWAFASCTKEDGYPISRPVLYLPTITNGQVMFRSCMEERWEYHHTRPLVCHSVLPSIHDKLRRMQLPPNTTTQGTEIEAL